MASLTWKPLIHAPQIAFEPADDRVDLEVLLVNQQRRRQVDKILEELPKKDRELLRMLFLEERDKSEICKRFKVREDYLRVLLHRAKLRFRSMHSKRFSTRLSPALAQERRTREVRISDSVGHAPGDPGEQGLVDLCGTVCGAEQASRPGAQGERKSLLQ